MKRTVLALMALAATASAVSAQGRWDRWDRYDRRSYVIEQAPNPGLNIGTVAAILAIQAMNAQKEKEVVVEREVQTERVRPLK
jgi:hypothetical protein